MTSSNKVPQAKVQPEFFVEKTPARQEKSGAPTSDTKGTLSTRFEKMSHQERLAALYGGLDTGAGGLTLSSAPDLKVNSSDFIPHHVRLGGDSIGEAIHAGAERAKTRKANIRDDGSIDAKRDEFLASLPGGTIHRTASKPSRAAGSSSDVKSSAKPGKPGVSYETISRGARFYTGTDSVPLEAYDPLFGDPNVLLGL